MAASCSIVCCGEDNDSDKVAVVQFSNGSIKTADKLDYTMYKNTDEINPRKKHRRILVAESARLSYVGSNFGAGTLKCNNLCKYYVGVLNKKTMQMEVHGAQIFNLHPVIPGETVETTKVQEASVSYRDKVDSLVEAFGTNKQKRALNVRRLNKVCGETLHHTVAKAANTVIEQKGLETLQQEVAETESTDELSLHLPPCNADADSPENVYLFDDLLSPADFGALEEVGAKMAALTPEELQKMRNDRRCLCVVKILENMQTADEETRDKMSRCAYYLSLLLKLARQKTVSRKFAQEEGCPRAVQTRLFRTFTVDTFNNGRVQNMVSSSMRAKLAAYSLALLLHVGHMTADLTLLHHDLGITEARMIEIAKAMRLTLIRPPRAKGPKVELQDQHKQVSLVLPLVSCVPFKDRPKRRKLR